MPCLSKSEVAQFYRIHFALLQYTNDRYNISAPLDFSNHLGAFSQEQLHEIVLPVRDYLFAHPKIVDEFIQKNPPNLSPEDLKLAKGWKHAVTGQFTIYKHLKAYTLVFSGEKERLYGIWGLGDPLEQVFPKQTLPLMAEMVVLPFKDRLVYDGLVRVYPILFGGGIQRSLKTEVEETQARYGVIIGFASGKPIYETTSNLTPDQRLIRFYLKNEANRELYWDEAWELARKNQANRIFYEQEVGKIYARSIKKDLKEYGIKGFHYAIYRNVIVAVGKSKKEVEEFCRQYHPQLINYLHFFKV
ncbi:MAG: hypothetical protein D6732_12545 [Methanobacteriota archaeon]|nr:MAG: hypothetical protein D6732_12545 [Euryarchaeota archaeon]